jgi:hypothetical protein
MKYNCSTVSTAAHLHLVPLATRSPVCVMEVVKSGPLKLRRLPSHMAGRNCRLLQPAWPEDDATASLSSSNR